MYLKNNGKKYQRIFSLLLAFTLLFSPLISYASNDVNLLSLDDGSIEAVENYIEKITPEVQEMFTNDNELIDVLVYMKDKADVYEVSKKNAIGRTPYAREISSRKAVINELRDVAEESQVNVLSHVMSQERIGKAKFIESFHIANIVHLKATKDVIEQIAKMSEVEAIYLNEIIQLDPPIINDITIESQNDDEIEWNIKKIGANNVWDQLGIDGTGVVVGIIDSGVDWDHPALKNKWRGYDPITGKTEPNGNWFDPQTNSTMPYDDAQVPHGSHCTGTILGSEENGTNRIGVAPGAKWIAAKALGSQGGSRAHLLAAADWMLKPGGKAENAPDIVNNSWGGSANTDPWFNDIVDAWRAANILPVFAAGNQKSGEQAPWPGSIQNPSSLLQSFAVGAIDINNKRGSFSKLGPSLFDPTGTHIKPDIAAPGVNIRSSVIDAYEGGWNGTSMAAPHVAGVAALMKQANPNLTISEMEHILKETAIPLTDSTYPTSPNMGYGYGLVNAYDAVSKVLGTGQGTIEGNVFIEGEDIEDPIIEHKEVEDVYIGEDTLISANIKDDVAITEVKLLIKNNEMSDWHEIPMILKSGDIKEGKYEALISGDFITDGGIAYKIKATDFGGNIVISSDYSIGIIFGIKPDEYSNDFEKELRGWKLEGEWKWGSVPENSTSEPVANSGTKLIGTNLGSYAVTNGMTSILTTPPIDLRDTKLETARIRFAQWYGISYFYTAEVQLSIDEGSTWKQIANLTGDKKTWHEVEYDLSEYIGSQVPIYMRLVFTTGDTGFSTGWYIDDFKVIGIDETPPAIPTNLKAKNVVEGIELSWEKVIDADLDKYIIYRADTLGGPYTNIGDIKTNLFIDKTVEDGKTYYYVITSIDKLGNESKYSNEVSIKYEKLEPIFFSDFEEDNGGFITGVVSGTVNDWEWGIPTAGPTTAQSGSKLWGTNLNGNFNKEQKSYIETPSITIPSDKGAELIFDSWIDTYKTSYSGTMTNGWANVQVSADDGTTWNVIGNEIYGSKKKWENINIDLSSYKGQTIKIRFYFESTLAYIGEKGWYIDNVLVVPKILGQKANETLETLDKFEIENKLESSIKGFIPVDATITILETGRSVRTSLSDGSFSIKHAASEEGKPWTLVVESYGYHTKEISVNLKEDETITQIIKLQPISKGTLRGTVISSDDNIPVVNAKVRVIEEPGILDITTDENGNFTINDLYEGSYSIKVSANGYYTSTANVNIWGSQDNSINISVDKFLAEGDPNEISYDDGTHEDKRVFVNSGAGFGVKFTPYKYGRLKSANIYFVDDHAKALGNEISIGVVKYDDKGNIEHFAPMRNITIVRGAWNEIDLTDFDVMTDQDFYIVTQQIHPIENSPGIGIDTSSTANRSYVYNGGSLVKLNGADGYNIPGGVMIRAIMEDVDASTINMPMVTNLTNENYVNKGTLTIEGMVKAEAKVNIYVNEVLTETVDTLNSFFEASIMLKDEESSISLSTQMGEKESAKTQPIKVIVDDVLPIVEVKNLESGQIFKTSEISLEGNVSDKNLNKVKLNGEIIELNEDSSFIKIITLREGLNDIIIEAIDRAGNKTIIKKAVEYRPDVLIPKRAIVIENGTIADENGEIIIAFDLIPQVKTIDKITVIIQAFDNNGKVYKAIYKDISINNIVENVEFILQESNYLKGISKVKVYVWDSLENMKPLSDVTEIR